MVAKNKTKTKTKSRGSSVECTSVLVYSAVDVASPGQYFASKMLEIADMPFCVVGHVSSHPAVVTRNCATCQIDADGTIFCKFEPASKVTHGVNSIEYRRECELFSLIPMGQYFAS